MRVKRKMTPLLLTQLEAQEIRIRYCGLLAKETQLKGYIPTGIGSIYSFRFNSWLEHIHNERLGL